MFCTKGELRLYRVSKLLQLYKDADISVKHIPIPDGHIPSLEDTNMLIEFILDKIINDNKVLMQ